MTAPRRSPLKSLTDTTNPPPAAELRSVPPAVGVPKGVAEGVPTAVLPDQQSGDGRHVTGWLTIRVPRRGTPTATSWCACGRDLFASGHAKVLALSEDHTAHRDACPLRATTSEGRAAA
ncbi:hypothetical protein GCM10011583_64660 [Streptomyces camponoticapitis]|uniref:Uncharacterized protein n=1 Tax=Streptomyces camponoticapitis TaxID=1616125 RepID=A0ABQ2ETD6_9ACTN|nr:hypothetical protein [Streptomyces camponoticapitis]GGK23797.1 hypothetical protein GCM10011583_64660 [Streptomyces camponoticapitis]